MQMLTRLFIDNYRCFVDFEHKPARRELIVGRNGSGKSSLFDALLFVRQLVVKGDALDPNFIAANRTRWLQKSAITIQIEADLGDGKYVYRLLLEPTGIPAAARVLSETLGFGERPIFEFTNGEVHLFNERSEVQVSYGFDWHRSALATVFPRPDNVKLARFKNWLGSLFCFRLNPFAMKGDAEAESLFPSVDLSNLTAWYRHFSQTYPGETNTLSTSLRESLDGFTFLKTVPAGERRLLVADFQGSDGRTNSFYLNELSDGQRCLIGLYAILNFVLARGGTVLFDEPDNFLSLREIQPWLLAVEDVVEEKRGQVLIISHHPEIINQWASSNCVQLVREAAGPVRTETLPELSETCLSPAELIARGWEHE